ncbi:porin [Amylibacter sp.]|nr:porin [Amylibacter sp.]
MKKLLIATTALVATAGMASADITISGHAAAGIYSNLSNKDGTAAVVAAAAKPGAVTADMVTAHDKLTTLGTVATNALTTATVTTRALGVSMTIELLADRAAEVLAYSKLSERTAAEVSAHAAALASYDSMLAAAAGTDGIATAAASKGTYSSDGIYSNAGVDFTMTGATDNGITFSATVNVDAGQEIDAADFELDGADGGTAGLGAVSMSGAFGTLTFDNSGIDNLYSDATTHDMSFSTTVGAVALTVGHSVGALAADTDYAKATSFSAGYTASGMAFTLLGSETAAGTSASLAMSYALNDTVSITADTDQVAGAESVQTIGASTTLNGVSVSVESANNSTWDVDLGYTTGGYVLAYGVDETDDWTATVSSDLGGGATFSAGVDSDDSMYAGVSFAF